MWSWNHKTTKIKPSSPVFETCWKIKTRIDPILSGMPCPVITVTSAGKSEGKTTTAVNLACTYARQNKKVLIIDANLRNPVLHKLLGMNNRSGLSNLCLDQYDQNEIVRCTKVPHLDLITSGPPQIDPVELLTSAQMSAFLDDLKKEYDFIIIDTPAALEWSDAHILASMSSGVLLVVKEGRAKKEDALRLKSAIEQVGATILGAVFHHAHRRKASAG